MAPLVLPSHAAWFLTQEVHDIERNALPEFFEKKSKHRNPDVYLKARNFVVETYRKNPDLYLSFTEIRKHLNVDVAAAHRIHEFLEHWGIINYQPSNLAQNVAHQAAARNESTVLFDGPNASTTVGAILEHTRRAQKSRSLAVRAPIYATPENPWTDTETLALLEALERFDEKWEDVAHHVGRPVDECILHFVSLPIEEPHCHETSLEAINTVAADPMVSQLSALASLTAPVSEEDAAAAGDAAEAMRSAASSLLEAVQRKAQAKIDEEEREVRSLLTSAIAVQMERIDAKIAHLDEATQLLHEEAAQLDQARHTIFGDRLALEKRRVTQSAPDASNSVPVDVSPPSSK